MKVAHCSLKEFNKLKPDADTVVISLTGSTNEVIENTGWKTFISYDFKVLSCHREFRPTDDQARALAEFIFPYIQGAQKVICQCEHGEIRSVAVAFGLAFSDIGDGKRFEVKNGEWVKSTGSAGDTFSGRTYGWIARTIDKKLKEKEDKNVDQPKV